MKIPSNYYRFFVKMNYIDTLKKFSGKISNEKTAEISVRSDDSIAINDPILEINTKRRSFKLFPGISDKFQCNAKIKFNIDPKDLARTLTFFSPPHYIDFYMKNDKTLFMCNYDMPDRNIREIPCTNVNIEI